MMADAQHEDAFSSTVPLPACFVGKHEPVSIYRARDTRCIHWACQCGRSWQIMELTGPDGSFGGRQ